MKVIITERAQKDLGRLDKPTQKRVLRALDQIASRPKATNLKKLEGHSNLLRLRVGDWRVILRISREEVTIYALRVMNRREAYRRL